QKTNINETLTTKHFMIVDGLEPGVQYFFRPVSDRRDTDCEHGIELTLIPANLCSLYIRDFMRIDFQNDPVEVVKLQGFLRIYQGEAGVPINGIFGRET